VPKILATNFPINRGYLVPCAVLLLSFSSALLDFTRLAPSLISFAACPAFLLG
jgi:hypothetical protein